MYTLHKWRKVGVLSVIRPNDLVLFLISKTEMVSWLGVPESSLDQPNKLRLWHHIGFLSSKAILKILASNSLDYMVYYRAQSEDVIYKHLFVERKNGHCWLRVSWEREVETTHCFREISTIINYTFLTPKRLALLQSLFILSMKMDKAIDPGTFWSLCTVQWEVFEKNCKIH